MYINDILLQNINKNEDNVFLTITKKPFKYKVCKNGIQPYRYFCEQFIPINRIIPLSNIQFAFEERNNIKRVCELSKKKASIQGPSYVFSLVKDERIFKNLE